MVAGRAVEFDANTSVTLEGWFRDVSGTYSAATGCRRSGFLMFEGEGSEAGSVNTLERGPGGLPPARTAEEWAGSVLRDWRGRGSELGGEALSAFGAEAVG